MRRLLFTAVFLLYPLISVKAQNTKLSFLEEGHPAKMGYLGDPSLGFASNMPRLLWHPQGRLLSSDLGQLYSPIHIWDHPTSASPPRVKGRLNVGGHHWAVSPQGDLLVAESLYTDGTKGRIGCYRFADATAIWENDFSSYGSILERTFSSDGLKIAVLSHKNRQCFLTLLDTNSGEVLSELALPGQTGGFFMGNQYLKAVKDGFLLVPPPSLLESGIWHVKLDPLRIEVIPTSGSFDQNVRLSLSQNERWLAISQSHSYEVLEQKAGTWQSWLRGESTYSLDHGVFFRGVAISPDSQSLLVHTRAQTRIINLSSKKIIKELEEGAEAMAFSPDGRFVVMTSHSGMAVLVSNTWTWHKYNMDRHKCPLEWLHAMPDNKTLLSADHTGLIVWDLPSRKARAILSVDDSAENTWLGRPAVTDNMKYIVASDGQKFLKWRLPDLSKSPPAKPEIIRGVPAFDDLPGTEKGLEMSAYADAQGGQIITVQDNKLLLRKWSSPDQVKTLGFLAHLGDLSLFNLAFLSDGKIWLHDNNQGYLVDLSTEQAQQISLPQPSFSRGAWLPKKEAFALSNSNETRLIHARDGKILQTFNNPERARSFDVSGNRRTNSVSTQDESTLILSMARGAHLPNILTFWKVESGDLIGELEITDGDIRSLAITSDGKTLAVGHSHTGISLWNVEKALANASPTKPAAVATQVSTGTRREFRTIQGLPEQPLHDGNHLWSFQNDGSCSVNRRMPSFARLRINGKPWKVELASHSQSVDPSAKSAFPHSPVNMDGSVDGEPIQVSRRIGTYFSMGAQSTVFATDGLTHYGTEERSLDLVYEMQFPSDTQGLLTDLSKAVSIPTDGNFSLAENQHWLAPSESGKLDESLAVVRVKQWSSVHSPAMHWNSESKVLSIQYRFVLPPGETLWLAHALAFAKRLEEDSLNSLNHEDRGDLGYLTLPADLNQAGNFSSPWEVEKPFNPRIRPLLNASGLTTNQAPLPIKDGMGQIWQPRQDGGRQGELGASSILQPWFAGRPASSGASRLIKSTVSSLNQALEAPPVITFSALSQPIRMLRRHHDSANGLSTIWADSLVNTSNEPRQQTVSYVTTFKSPVVAIYDALGRVYTPNTLPSSGDNFGGALAFALEGEHKPATLLAFHHGNASLTPSFRWMGSRAISLDFALSLEPAKTVTLLLGGCQRPLQAFASPSEAFSDWLPLKMPLPLESTPQSQVQLSKEAANYQLNSN